MLCWACVPCFSFCCSHTRQLHCAACCARLCVPVLPKCAAGFQTELPGLLHRLSHVYRRHHHGEENFSELQISFRPVSGRAAT